VHREERIEQRFDVFRIDARPGTATAIKTPRPLTNVELTLSAGAIGNRPRRVDSATKFRMTYCNSPLLATVKSLENLFRPYSAFASSKTLA
jgi:hypothetical protein